MPELIDGIPDHLRTTIEAPTTPKTTELIGHVPGRPTSAEEDSAAPTREPIVVSRPGDPGYDELLAKHNAQWDLLKAAANMYGPPKG